MLMLLTVAGSAVLPALSTQEPVLVTDWPLPSVVKVAPATVSMSTPEPPVLSVQEKFAATSVLFQPLALAAGLLLPVIAGLFLSMLMFVTLAGSALLPAVSLQLPFTDWPAPSVVTVTSSGLVMELPVAAPV